MKKIVIILVFAWILAPYLHAFQIGATIGTGIGAAKAFTGFAEVATTIFLWIAFLAFIFVVIGSIFSKKKNKDQFKQQSVRYIEKR